MPARRLVLAPTRELADQVANNVKAYAKHSKLRSMVVFGGIDMKPQTAELKTGVEVLIATPSRSPCRQSHWLKAPPPAKG